MPKLSSTASSFADPETGEVLELIHHFRRTATALVTEFQQQLRTKDLLRAWKLGKCERTGRLKRSKARYTFHGVGVRFELRGREVDVEFRPNGRSDGFDTWRLFRFAESAFEWQGLGADQIENALTEMAEDGTIEQPGWEPSPELYYLK